MLRSLSGHPPLPSRRKTQGMNEQKKRVVSIGEVMIEMSRGADGRFGLACGGDTFNTAVYLSRRDQIASPPHSGTINIPRASCRSRMRKASAPISFCVCRDACRHYMVEINASGERTFNYGTRGARPRIVRVPDWAGSPRRSCRRAWFISPVSRCRSIPTTGSGACSPYWKWRGRKASRSCSTAIIVRASGKATSLAPGRCSPKRSSASTSRCRPTTTRRCCGAIPRLSRRSSDCDPSGSARSR